MDITRKKDYLVGINYFSGWWRQNPNKYKVLSDRDWRMDYPDRTGLLGCFNDQETMDAEIIAASEHGVDFFLMLWYVETPERHPHGTKLNNGLRQFLASPENRRMKFAIDFCNHPPFEILDDKQWVESCDEWVQAMKHPSYLKIGGKSVFNVFSAGFFLEQCGGSAEEAIKFLEILKRTAEEEGVGPLLLGTGVYTNDKQDEELDKVLKSFDFRGTYMDLPDLPILGKDYEYDDLLDFCTDFWEKQLKISTIPYMPFLPAGWNPKAWGDPRPAFELPDREKWEKGLRLLKSYLDEYAQLRIPDGTSEGCKTFTIYAWNEFAEGGIVAPTIGDGWMKLEVIKEVFGK